MNAGTFKKANRLRYKSEFDAVFQSRKIKTGFLTLFLKPNLAAVARLGVIVPKRFIKQANDRNYLKRLIREAFRTFKAEIGANDLIVYVNREVREEEATFESVSEMMKRLKSK